jgi:hypothetical protein
VDWNRAIARNTAALEAIVAALFVLAGLAPGAAPARIARALHAKALRVLRPAESALRRLIVIAARGLVAKPVPKRLKPQGPIPPAQGQGRASFRLFDPRKRFLVRASASLGPKREPRIHVFGNSSPLAPVLQASSQHPLPPSEPDGHINAIPLRRRLAAFAVALADIPKQAKRLARWKAKRRQLGGHRFTEPLRPGRPPGYRRVALHEVDHVLAECHGLSIDALRPDTS